MNFKMWALIQNEDITHNYSSMVQHHIQKPEESVSVTHNTYAEILCLLLIATRIIFMVSCDVGAKIQVVILSTGNGEMDKIGKSLSLLTLYSTIGRHR